MNFPEPSIICSDRGRVLNRRGQCLYVRMLSGKGWTGHGRWETELGGGAWLWRQLRVTASKLASVYKLRFEPEEVF